MDPYIQSLQTEHEAAKSRRPRGPAKKQNQKLGVALHKLNNAKKIKEKVDDIISTHIELIDGSYLQEIKIHLNAFIEKPEEE